MNRRNFIRGTAAILATGAVIETLSSCEKADTVTPAVAPGTIKVKPASGKTEKWALSNMCIDFNEANMADIFDTVHGINSAGNDNKNFKMTMMFTNDNGDMLRLCMQTASYEAVTKIADETWPGLPAAERVDATINFGGNTPGFSGIAADRITTSFKITNAGRSTIYHAANDPVGVSTLDVQTAASGEGALLEIYNQGNKLDTADKNSGALMVVLFQNNKLFMNATFLSETGLPAPTLTTNGFDDPMYDGVSLLYKNGNYTALNPV